MIDVDIFFINLDSATERRVSVEDSFGKNNFPRSWVLNRFPAIESSSEMVSKMPGPLTARQKGCFLSHLECAKMALSNNAKSYVMIAEDDVLFSKKTAVLINELICNLPKDDWDVIYTDAAINGERSKEFIEYLLNIHDNFCMDGFVRVIDLKGLPRFYSGTTCYLINKLSLQKFINKISDFIRLMEVENISLPFDWCFQILFSEGQLNSFLTFPFLTTVSGFAENSQVNESNINISLIDNVFRNLMWIDSTSNNSILNERKRLIENFIEIKSMIMNL